MSKLSILILLAFFALMTMPASLAQAQDADAAAAGTAVIWDSGAALSDSITYSMTDIPDPAAGTVYVGWLISDDGTVKLNTGGAMAGRVGRLHRSQLHLARWRRPYSALQQGGHNR